jgi:hypothetical protein
MGNIFVYLNSYENVPGDFSRTFFIFKHKCKLDNRIHSFLYKLMVKKERMRGKNMDITRTVRTENNAP